MSNHLSIVNNTELKKIAHLCEEHLKKVKHDLPIQNILSTINIIMEVREHNFSDKAKQLTEQIWTALEKRDVWYESDFRLLGVILFFFPIETIQEITEKILTNLEKYNDYKNIKGTQASILFNLSTVYFLNNRLDDCQRITEMILPLAKQTKRYDRLGFAQVRLGICQGADRRNDLARKLERRSQTISCFLFLSYFTWNFNHFNRNGEVNDLQRICIF